ncbi:hypothetical protein CEUSTIGMA_g1041.t1 [Chlamydomonas eustigma]|uniref:NAD(+) kinase n=1 Tax=Chlamydomonas eustigma TaxID=1157962 RepID=A0A250WST0_9CHLO|nr:hypothetical protein CEUSTIGMA_g1041.t1 [Chlamydomonas eustigma]|eukprot:GAX73590.1 hypothetical protein CEUSTIGMA_g1041.t1 [Chlamydomonas eustigma]
MESLNLSDMEERAAAAISELQSVIFAAKQQDQVKSKNLSIWKADARDWKARYESEQRRCKQLESELHEVKEKLLVLERKESARRLNSASSLNIRRTKSGQCMAGAEGGIPPLVHGRSRFHNACKEDSSSVPCNTQPVANGHNHHHSAMSMPTTQIKCRSEEELGVGEKIVSSGESGRPEGQALTITSLLSMFVAASCIAAPRPQDCCENFDHSAAGASGGTAPRLLNGHSVDTEGFSTHHASTVSLEDGDGSSGVGVAAAAAVSAATARAWASAASEGQKQHKQGLAMRSSGTYSGYEDKEGGSGAGGGRLDHGMGMRSKSTKAGFKLTASVSRGDLDFSRRSAATSSESGSPRVPPIMSKRVHTYPEALDEATAASHSLRSSTRPQSRPSETDLISATDTIHESFEEENLCNHHTHRQSDEISLIPTADKTEGLGDSIARPEGPQQVPDACAHDVGPTCDPSQLQHYSEDIGVNDSLIGNNKRLLYTTLSHPLTSTSTSTPSPPPQLQRKSTTATLPLSKGSPKILPPSTFSQLSPMNGLLSLSPSSLVQHDAADSALSTSPRAQWKHSLKLAAAIGVSTTQSEIRTAFNPPPVPQPPQEVSDLTSFNSDAAASSAAANPEDPECVLLEELAPKTTTLTLHWLSPPKTALVVCKLAPKVKPYFIRALKWFRSCGLSVYVEPAMWEVVAEEQVTMLLQQQQGRNGSLKQHPSVATAIPRSEYESEVCAGNGLHCLHIDGVLTWTPHALLSPSAQNGGVAAGTSVPDELAQNLDFVLVLGGDGTLMWTCHLFGNRAVPPLIPFNLGSLGFLTPFAPEQLTSCLQQVVSGGFPMILRHRLHCIIVKAKCRGLASGQLGTDEDNLDTPSGSPAKWEHGHCATEKVVLNEVVIDRGTAPFLTNLEAFCDGTFVTRIQGDGLIVSTPTGSTAYNLAAGGSMVHPQVPAILFTPICPHSLSFRPLVFPDHVQLCIQVPANARSEMWCSFDGKDRQALRAGDAVIIRTSQWPLPTVCSRDPSRDWFMGVREGLQWNARRTQGGAGQ